MIGFFVYRSINESLDLVSADYYDNEIKYQQQINQIQNTLALKVKPITIYNKTDNFIEIKFPDTMKTDLIAGEINFFKPDNASLDFNVKIELDSNNIQTIDTKKLTIGVWKLKTKWTSNSISYYQEESIFIN